MTAKPLDWVSWWEARCRMPEIWDGWSYDRWGADKPMVNSLRSGEVHYRGEAHEASSYGVIVSPWLSTPSISLKDVGAGLLSLSVGSTESTAEYETTVWTAPVAIGRLPWQTAPRPITRKKTAVIRGAEIAWEEFCDYLIRCELPAGVEPIGNWRRARAAAKPGRRRVQQSRGPRPFWREGDQEIDKWLEDNGRPEPGDGNQAQFEEHMASWLQNHGHAAGEATIRRHVQQGIKRYRAKVDA